MTQCGVLCCAAQNDDVESVLGIALAADADTGAGTGAEDRVRCALCVPLFAQRDAKQPFCLLLLVNRYAQVADTARTNKLLPFTPRRRRCSCAPTRLLLLCSRLIFGPACEHSRYSFSARF